MMKDQRLVSPRVVGGGRPGGANRCRVRHPVGVGGRRRRPVRQDEGTVGVAPGVDLGLGERAHPQHDGREDHGEQEALDPVHVQSLTSARGGVYALFPAVGKLPIRCIGSVEPPLESRQARKVGGLTILHERRGAALSGATRAGTRCRRRAWSRHPAVCRGGRRVRRSWNRASPRSCRSTRRGSTASPGRRLPPPAWPRFPGTRQETR